MVSPQHRLTTIRQHRQHAMCPLDLGHPQPEPEHGPDPAEPDQVILVVQGHQRYRHYNWHQRTLPVVQIWCISLQDAVPGQILLS